jgi:hypothetical protein
VLYIFYESAGTLTKVVLVSNQPTAKNKLQPQKSKTMNGNVDEDALCEVVTQMICIWDDLEGADETDSMSVSAPEMVQILCMVKSSVDLISSPAACTGMPAAERLSNILYGQEEKDASNRPSCSDSSSVSPSLLIILHSRFTQFLSDSLSS